MARTITQKSILQVLSAGFALVILMLAIAAYFGLRGIQTLESSTGALLEDQLVTNRLLDEVQKQQASLGEIFSILARDPDEIAPERILPQLATSDENIARIAAAGERTSHARLWKALEQAAKSFSDEVRRLVNAEEPDSFVSRDLFRRHERMVAVTAQLIEASYHDALAAQNHIDARSTRLTRDTMFLLGTCLGLALLFTIFTVRITTQLFRRMEWQTGELSRVSWHMLEAQETTARRFSHELHDELGQSLTAVKANLLGLETAGVNDESRLRDCYRLVDEAISNVRQLSQLLRPTILDDFGLAAGLRWLAEGFTHRTGIEVEVRSSLETRLVDETETHLFRIAQEALTNVARHSQARRVGIDLEARGGEVTLTIHDDGQGFRESTRQDGMGMIGMRARARSAGGDLEVLSRAGEGVTLKVRVPAEGARQEKNDPYPVG